MLTHASKLVASFCGLAWCLLGATPATPFERIPQPSAPIPETVLKKVKKVFETKGKRAKVKIRFSSAGTTGFQCSLTRLKGKATKAAPFKACASPKTYTLRPGRYRFQVQALKGTVADPTPAVRGFKVVRIAR